MKKNLFVFTISACFLGIILSSYEHGPAYEAGLNRTGSTGGVANCNGGSCHGANVATTIVTLGVTDALGATVTSYIPGHTYNITLNGHNTASSTCSKFGFQVSATLSGAAQAGSFIAASGTNTRVVNLSGIQIIEHKSPLHDTATNYSVVHFTWTAPVAGSGLVTFYSILNAVGGDGDDGGRTTEDDDDDDDSDSYFPNTGANVVLTESGNTSGVNDVRNIDQVGMYPNPMTDALNIALKGAYSIKIYAANGMAVYSAKVTEPLAAPMRVPAADLQPGIYYVEIMQGNDRVVKTVIKQ